MILALAQVAESADRYDSATVALFALFIVSLIVTAGLLLRDLLGQDNERQYAGPWLQRDALDDPPTPSLAATTQHSARPVSSDREASVQPAPLWFRQVMATQQGDVAEGIARTVHQLVEAGNRGDIRQGFALYTPEFVARQQTALSLPPVELERLMRATPQPAQHPVAVAGITDIAVDPPNRASALVSYESEDKPRDPERYYVVYDHATGSWLIDDIESAPS